MYDEAVKLCLLMLPHSSPDVRDAFAAVLGCLAAACQTSEALRKVGSGWVAWPPVLLEASMTLSMLECRQKCRLLDGAGWVCRVDNNTAAERFAQSKTLTVCTNALLASSGATLQAT